MPINSGSFTISFQNQFPIYENQIRCHIKEEEYNLTLNPSLQVNSSGSVLDFATGSIFNPYVTTIGLYNDREELMAVAKLGKPIQISGKTEMVFIIKLDK